VILHRVQHDQHFQGPHNHPTKRSTPSALGDDNAGLWNDGSPDLTMYEGSSSGDIIRSFVNDDGTLGPKTIEGRLETVEGMRHISTGSMLALVNKALRIRIEAEVFGHKLWGDGQTGIMNAFGEYGQQLLPGCKSPKDAVNTYRAFYRSSPADMQSGKELTHLQRKWMELSTRSIGFLTVELKIKKAFRGDQYASAYEQHGPPSNLQGKRQKLA